MAFLRKTAICTKFLSIVFLFVIGISMFPRESSAALSHDWRLQWRTLSSQHFSVHYHDGSEEAAQQALNIAESVHKKLSPVFDWVPENRTDIILTDEFGLSNGWATPYPSNRSGIYLAPPDQINSLEDHAGWLETVITHEYVHILHIDKAEGAPDVLRSVFGRNGSWLTVAFGLPLPLTVFPNATQPPWYIEGLATWYETDLERGIGRGQSSYFDMMMRMEVDGGVKTVRHVNQPMVSWPGGTSRYLYGVHFFNFVAERKGESKIQALVDDMSNDIIPFRVNANSKNTFGMGQGQIWREFTEYLNNKYRPRLEAIEREGVREGKAITAHGYSTGQALVNAKGDVYYIRDDWRHHTALMVKRAGDSRVRHLVDINFEANFDLHPDAGIVLAQPEVCYNARLHYDLYIVDANSGSRDRITDCGRYHYGAWLPDGKHIVAAKLEGGRSSLHRLNLEGEELETYWQARKGEVLGGLDVAPDGRTIVSSVWRPESGWNIEEFNLQARQWRTLTGSRAIEAQPRYSPDGKSILFSSDHGGVYNVRRLDRGSGELVTLTHVRGGAFMPALGSDQRTLYYTGYTSKGFDVYRLDLTNEPLPTPAAPVGTSGVLAATGTYPEVKAEKSSYSPWSTLGPTWWQPHLVADSAGVELGAFTGGWDVLERHSYFLDLAYDVVNDWAVGSADYIYDRWTPTFKLHASRYNDVTLADETDADTTSVDEGDVIRVRKHDTAQVEFVFPWLRLGHTFSFHMAAYTDRESSGFVEDEFGPKPDRTDNVAGAAMVYNSTNWYARSVTRSDGRIIRIVGESSDIDDADDYTGNIYLVDWREYFRIWGEHVVALRAVQGWGTESPREFELGGSRRAPATPAYLGSTVAGSPFNQRQFALRGYPAGLSALEGPRMRMGSLEYRFPLYRLERGITIPPVGLHQVHGTLFTDAGGTWETDEDGPDKYYAGVGFELNLDIVIGYWGLIPARIGIAQGRGDLGETQAYIQFGDSF